MKEEIIHSHVCQYLRVQYPRVIFNTDLSGIKLPIGLAKKVKTLRSSNAFPDIVIYEPRKGFHALFIELKADGIKIVKKDGAYYNEHIQAQAIMIDRLMKLGYFACFAVGFNQAKQIIDSYLRD